MRGITIAVFLVVVGVAVAYPRQWGRSQRADSDEELYPSGRTRPISSRRAGNPPQTQYYFGSSPRYVPYSGAEYVQPEQPQYRLYRQPRDDDDDSDEEEDDLADDEGGDDDDVQDDGFDTPTWEELFPRKQQGSYGQVNSGNAGGPPPQEAQTGGFSVGGAPQVQDDTGSYEIQADGPGGPNWSGGINGQARAQFVSGPKKRYRPVTVKLVKPRNYEMVPMKKSTKNGPRWVVHPDNRNQWSYPQQTPYQYVSSPNRRWSQQSQRQPYWAYPSRGNVWRSQRRNNKSWGYY